MTDGKIERNDGWDLLWAYKKFNLDGTEKDALTGQELNLIFLVGEAIANGNLVWVDTGEKETLA